MSDESGGWARGEPRRGAALRTSAGDGVRWVILTAVPEPEPDDWAPGDAAATSSSTSTRVSRRGR